MKRYRSKLLLAVLLLFAGFANAQSKYYMAFTTSVDTLYACGDTICDPVGNDTTYPYYFVSHLFVYPEDPSSVFIVSGFAATGGTDHLEIFDILTHERVVNITSNTSLQTFGPFTANSGIEIYFSSNYLFSNDSFQIVATCVNQPTCLPVFGLRPTHLNVDSIVVAWLDTSNNYPDYYVEYSIADSNNWSSFITSDTFAVISSLATDTPYDIRVRAVCEPGDSSLFGETITVRTLLKPPVSMPFNCTFENALVNSAWVIEGNQTNKWCIGSAVNNTTGGDSAIYISNDNGASNYWSYMTQAQWTDAVAYVIFRAPAGEYNCHYDWRCNGGDLRVLLTPIDNTSTITSSTGLYTTGTFPLDGGYLGNGPSVHGHRNSSNWNTRDLNLFLTEGTYKLELRFKYDSYLQPPAAVDNFRFAPVSCNQPADLAVSATATTVTASWTPNGNETAWIVSNGVTSAMATSTSYTFTNLTPATNYNISVAAYCGEGDTSIALTALAHTACAAATLPFVEDFENPIYLGNHQYEIPCWQVLNLDNDILPWGISENYPHSGNYCAGADHYYGSNSNDWLITPELYLPTGSFNYYVEWYARGGTGTNFIVEVVTTDSHDTTVLFNGYVPYSWVHNKYDITSLAGHTVKVIFISNGSAPSVWIDDVTIASCAPPTVVTATCDMNFITLNWNHGGTESAWEVSNGTTTVVVYDTFYTFTGLAPSTTYNFSVRSICGAGDTSVSLNASFTTLTGQVITTLPYFCTFDEPEGSAWTLENGNHPNAWYVDTAAYSNLPHAGHPETLTDNHGLYISNDGGVSNEYDVEIPDYSDVYVFAYRTFYLTPGEYEYNYDWRAYGWNGEDYLRVVMAPVSVEIDANNPSQWIGYFLPSGVIPLEGQGTNSHGLYWDSIWSTKSGDFTISTPGQYNMVFFWRNDYTFGVQPPAAVDNVGLRFKSCPNITGLAALGTGSDHVVVGWDASTAQGWQVQYGPWGFPQGTGTMMTVNTNQATIGYLDAMSAYDVYVRQICGVEDTGFWSSITVATGLCDNNGVVTVGDPAGYSTDSSVYMPVATNRDYSLCEIIVDSAELGELTDIDAIQFYYHGPNPIGHEDSIDIYLQPTSKDEFADVYDMEPLDTVNAVRVFSGSFEHFQPGWNTVRFDTSYQYSGNGNLMVLVDNNSGTWSYRSEFATVSCNGNKTFCYSYSYSNPDPADTSTLSSDTYYRNVYSQRPYMRFVTCSADSIIDTTIVVEPCLSPIDFHVTATMLNSATFDWTPNEGDSLWRIYVWNTGTEPIAYDVTSHPATVGGLTQFTFYNAKVVTVCNDTTESEPSNIVGFTTNECQPVANAAVSNVQYTSAVISWTGNAASYSIEYGLGDFEQDHGTLVSGITETSYTILGLDPDHNYSAYVRANCDENNHSAWSQRLRFRTIYEGFDGSIPTTQPTISIFPNPTSGSTTIALNGVKGDVIITIVDLNGRTWYAGSLACDGDCLKTVDVSGLAAGSYFVRVNGNGINTISKLVVK